MATKPVPGFDGIFPAIRRYDLRLFDMKGNSLLHKIARFR